MVLNDETELLREQRDRYRDAIWRIVDDLWHVSDLSQLGSFRSMLAAWMKAESGPRAPLTARMSSGEFSAASRRFWDDDIRRFRR